MSWNHKGWSIAVLSDGRFRGADPHGECEPVFGASLAEVNKQIDKAPKAKRVPVLLMRIAEGETWRYEVARGELTSKLDEFRGCRVSVGGKSARHPHNEIFEDSERNAIILQDVARLRTEAGRLHNEADALEATATSLKHKGGLK